MPYHYVGHVYAEFLPYGDALGGLPMLNRGFVGVELFFLISGFVIFMTLERCSGFADFLVRRWLRLFPALFLASLLVLAMSHVMGSYMPHGPHNLRDVLPGFTYLSPAFYHAVFNVPFSFIDGVYWTLSAEFTFYFVAGILYYHLGWARAVTGLGLLWIGVKIAVALFEILPRSPLSRVTEPLLWQGVQHFGWFVSGALFFKARELNSERLFLLALMVGLFAVLIYSADVVLDPMMKPVLYLCVVFFACAQRLKWLQTLLKWPPLLFVGFVSYPLYLLHGSLGVGLIGLLATVVPAELWYGLPVAVAAFMLLLAWLFADKLEPATRNGFASMLKRLGLLKAKRG